jgi:uncharacterized protein YxeA
MITAIVEILVGIVLSIAVFVFMQYKYGEFKWYVVIDDDGKKYYLNNENVEVDFDSNTIKLKYSDGGWVFIDEAGVENSIIEDTKIRISDNHFFRIKKDGKTVSSEAIIGAVTVLVLALLFFGIIIWANSNTEANLLDSNSEYAKEEVSLSRYDTGIDAEI